MSDLVIGLGNPQRGDDGVGWWLARRARRLQPAPQVRLLHQPTPELAAELAAARRVLFVDAWRASAVEAAAGPRLRPLAAALPPSPAALSHQLPPQQVLALAHQLWPATAVQAWELLVPAMAFGHGAGLSAALRQGLPAAERLLHNWCRSATPPADTLTVVGIDVGGRRKGFHAVALRDGAYADQLASADPVAVARWCREVIGARVVAIDAPCRWSCDGRPRPCERELLAQGIRCFTSPTRASAVAHPSDYFGWMLQGEALYQALEPSHPLLAQLPLSGPCSVETFPHAITWHLRGGHASAADKRRQRSALLHQAGIDLTPLTSIDRLDAALCAFAAHQAARGEPCRTYGIPDSGLILVPRGDSLPGSPPCTN